jgi:hypothetical protein
VFTALGTFRPFPVRARSTRAVRPIASGLSLPAMASHMGVIDRGARNSPGRRRVRCHPLNVSSAMRDTAAAIAKRFTEAAVAAAEAAMKGVDRLLEGTLPAPRPQLVPVRVRNQPQHGRR